MLSRRVVLCGGVGFVDLVMSRVDLGWSWMSRRDVVVLCCGWWCRICGFSNVAGGFRVVADVAVRRRRVALWVVSCGWSTVPLDGLSERAINIEKGVTNQANTFELKATRAIVNDPELHAELKTSKLTPVNTAARSSFAS